MPSATDLARLTVSERVAGAVAAGRPVVALETTLVTHGLPHPQGLEVARELESIVTAEGAIPATIGVLDGRLQVGLGAAELERLATTDGVEKLGLGNLAAGIVSGAAGSTTVAATLLAAHRAGIRVCATGGIGGVHRGVAESGDVSADLTILGRVPIAVVCAGAKAVLDLPRTLETLETLGVPVYGFRTERFPAFYRRDSGLPVDRGFQEVDHLALAVQAHFQLGVGSGVVVANPISSTRELPAVLVDSALERALEELRERDIQGRAVTPFLLERMRALTEDQSVVSNRALLLDNARLAARLAVALGTAR